MACSVAEIYRLSAIILGMKALLFCIEEGNCFAKTSVNFYKFAWRHVSEDDNALCSHFRENSNSNSDKSVC